MIVNRNAVGVFKLKFHGLDTFAMGTTATLFALLFLAMSPLSAHSQKEGTVVHLANMQVSLRIDNITVGDSPTGLILVKGIVYNNSTESLVNVKVKVDLYGPNDELITETTRFVTPASSIFRPGYQSDFDFLVTAADVDHYNITAYGSRAQ
jgi:hypothetical protein